MECVVCKQGHTHPGTARVALERGETTVVVKDVPAEICDNCGEHYLDETVSARLLALAEGAARQGVEVGVLRFAA